MNHEMTEQAPAGVPRDPGFLKSTTDEGWETCRILIPPEEIGFLVAIFEAYENEFLVRTEQKGLGLVRIWFPSTNRETLDRVLAEFRQEFPVEVLMRDKGMAGLDEIYPDTEAVTP